MSQRNKAIVGNILEKIFQYIWKNAFQHSNIRASNFVGINSYLECSMHASNENPGSNLLMACLI